MIFMDDIFIVFGVVSLQFIPIVALTYLQNEITIISKIFENSHSKLLSIMAMLFAFGLIFINTLIIEQTSRIIISILLIITLSMSINYTYKDYTIDEGFYITIPYFIIYSCLVFILGIAEYPFYTIKSYTFSLMFISSLICYILFSLSIFLGVQFHSSYLNYIAFIGLCISTLNVMLIIDYNQNKNQQIKFLVNFLLFQLIHIYLYLTHLLSVKFEINSKSQTLNICKWCCCQEEK